MSKVNQIIDCIVAWIASSPKKSLFLAGVILSLLMPGLANTKTDYGVRVWFQQSDPLLKKFDYF